MMWTNYHSHNTFCDGRETMEEFVKYAIAKGVKKYGFSSHAPLPFHTHWTMNAEDYPEYETEFYRLKDKYKDSIELFLVSKLIIFMVLVMQRVLFFKILNLIML